MCVALQLDARVTASATFVHDPLEKGDSQKRKSCGFAWSAGTFVLAARPSQVPRGLPPGPRPGWHAQAGGRGRLGLQGCSEVQ